MSGEPLPGPSITAQPEAATESQQQGIQAANAEGLLSSDPFTAGLPEAVKIEGVASKTPTRFGEMGTPTAAAQDSTSPPQPAAPVAAPVNQIAPVSANGEQTSARSSPSADVPANGQPSEPVADALSTSPGLSPADATAPTPEAPAPAGEAVVEEAVDNSVEEALVDEFGEPLGMPEEQQDPFKQAESFLTQIPGKMRLY